MATLPGLLQTLERADQGLLDLSEEAQKQIVAELATKIDAYKYLDEKFDLEIERMAKQVRDLQAVKKTLTSNKERLRELMDFHMKENKFERLPGETYAVQRIVKKHDIELTVGPPTAEDVVAWPAFVKASYSWDAVALKNAIKADPTHPVLSWFGEPKESSYIKFSVRRDV